MPDPGDQRSDLLPLASEVWWYGSVDGQGVEVPSERERSSEEDGCRTGFGHGDSQGVLQGKLVDPERRRRTVKEVRRRLGPDRVSERKACRVLGQPRSTQRYESRKPSQDEALLKEMRRITHRRPRFGCPRVYDELTKRGWQVNRKRVHRLWKQEHMQIARKQQKRRRLPGHSGNGCIRHRPMHKDHVWSYDFLTDRTEDGRQLKLLAVIDEHTRESLAIEVGRSFTAPKVVDVLRYLFALRGRPQHVRSDNGPEFVSRVVRRWLDQAEVGPLFIAKGSPWENGYIESFNARIRDELLNRELFLSVTEAQWVIDRWRNDYNHHRPHSSLNYQTPAAFAAVCTDSIRPTASFHQHRRITGNCIT